MPELPFRKITRLPGYNYRSYGPYVITTCTQDRVARFGRVSASGDLTLNDAGTMVLSIWCDIPRRFPGVELDACIVMPNHFHGLLALGADEPGRQADLADIIGWFKAVTTNRYIWGVRDRGWPRFHERLWQRKFYEHIMRNDRDLERCQQYIANNPIQWSTDRYYAQLPDDRR